MGRTAPKFAHPSEAEVARILDFYRIAWMYEPRTFPIGWDLEGNVTASFTPDFYLPSYDLYLEVTVSKQRLLTKKHRKIRRLRLLYPRVNIKLFNRKDVERLFEKFDVRASA